MCSREGVQAQTRARRAPRRLAGKETHCGGRFFGSLAYTAPVGSHSAAGWGDTNEGWTVTCGTHQAPVHDSGHHHHPQAGIGVRRFRDSRRSRPRYGPACAKVPHTAGGPAAWVEWYVPFACCIVESLRSVSYFLHDLRDPVARGRGVGVLRSLAGEVPRPLASISSSHQAPELTCRAGHPGPNGHPKPPSLRQPPNDPARPSPTPYHHPRCTSQSVSQPES